MPDIATISAFLGSIKTATDIAKTIKSVDASLEKAELKLKIAELIVSLADAKMSAVEIQDLIKEKDEKIISLEKAFELKSHIVRRGFAYYEMDEHGDATGDPFCSYCWEEHHKTIHLHQQEFGNHIPNVCPSCKNEFDYSASLSIHNRNERE